MTTTQVTKKEYYDAYEKRDYKDQSLEKFNVGHHERDTDNGNGWYPYSRYYMKNWKYYRDDIDLSDY